jgi:hypothetical protein
MIGLAFQVGGCGWFWSVDAVIDRQQNEHNAIAADAIEGSPPQTTYSFKYRVRDFADDLW